MKLDVDELVKQIGDDAGAPGLAAYRIHHPMHVGKRAAIRRMRPVTKFDDTNKEERICIFQ